MRPHPDFAQITLPRRCSIGAYRLTPLTMDETDEDYATVMESAPVLTEIFEDWPAGLTREGNQIDLAWHDREFDLKRSFSWIIRDADGAYLGCFYVFPEPGARGRADAVMWVRAGPDRATQAVELRALLGDWCAVQLPQTLALTWQTSPAL